MFHNPSYRIGCPVWSCPNWRGSVYASQAPRRLWLGQYSKLFNTVEGNSTFYGIPKPETFARWGAEAEQGFRFCLKFPRSISHEGALIGVDRWLEPFLHGLSLLQEADCLGATFLQMGPAFGPENFEALSSFLHRLPSRFGYAVEVRHPGWFVEPYEHRLVELLEALQMDRVIFDSRPLFEAPPVDAIESAARERKPRVPVRTRVTGDSPMLRLIGRNQVDHPAVIEAIEQWTEVVALWIQSGRTPIVFAHAPDDAHAPEFARRFHNRLAERLPDLLKPVNRWPFSQPQQKSLF